MSWGDNRKGFRETNGRLSKKGKLSVLVEVNGGEGLRGGGRGTSFFSKKCFLLKSIKFDHFLEALNSKVV